MYTCLCLTLYTCWVTFAYMYIYCSTTELSGHKTLALDNIKDAAANGLWALSEDRHSEVINTIIINTRQPLIIEVTSWHYHQFCSFNIWICNDHKNLCRHLLFPIIYKANMCLRWSVFEQKVMLQVINKAAAFSNFL